MTNIIILLRKRDFSTMSNIQLNFSLFTIYCFVSTKGYLVRTIHFIINLIVLFLSFCDWLISINVEK